jgi:large subunit ribosomal protein L1
MGRRSKKYNKQAEALAKESVEIPEAVKQLKSIASAGFDQSIECVVQLGIDPKQADQQVRGAVSLPHGIGKQKRVIAFCEESDAQTARQAGAIEAGCDELIKKIQDGWMDFDVAIASPKVMGKVGKLGRTLGPQGKMPTPKNGTVTTNMAASVSEFAAGKVEFKNDGGGNVHAVVGKQSFDEEKLISNIEAFITHIKRIRPATAKGGYIKNVFISATMSPSVRISI